MLALRADTYEEGCQLTPAVRLFPPPESANTPSDPEVTKVADKLAQFVATNGRSFEGITKERNPGNTPFRHHSFTL